MTEAQWRNFLLLFISGYIFVAPFGIQYVKNEGGGTSPEIYLLSCTIFYRPSADRNQV